MSHGVLPAGGEGQRGPGLALGLALLDDEVTDGRAAVVLGEEPVDLAGVGGQVLCGEGDADGPGDI